MTIRQGLLAMDLTIQQSDKSADLWQDSKIGDKAELEC